MNDPVEETLKNKAIEKQVEREIQEILDEKDRESIEKHGHSVVSRGIYRILSYLLEHKT